MHLHKWTCAAMFQTSLHVNYYFKYFNFPTSVSMLSKAFLVIISINNVTIQHYHEIIRDTVKHNVKFAYDFLTHEYNIKILIVEICV